MEFKNYPYDEKEVSEGQILPNRRGLLQRVFNRPCTDRENILRAFEGKPVWYLTSMGASLTPAVLPDNIARHFVSGANVPEDPNYAGKDMFGVEWVYVPEVGGSMVKPGNPLLADANEWREKIVWPDVNSWDWEGDTKANIDRLSDDNANIIGLLNGCWFERLISFMDFDGAATALIDEDQQDAVKEIFQRTTDIYCQIVDKFCDYYGDKITGFQVHDDWGAQKDCFFSPETGKEMIVPYMKQLTDKIHSRGKTAELHSCGKLEKQIGNFVAAGWDAWGGMAINDTKAIYEKWGDQMLIGVYPDPIPEGADKATKEQMARDHVDKYPHAFMPFSRVPLDQDFADEIYRYSRQKYAK